MIAEYEREKILERTRRGRRYAARQGRLSVFGRAPYGYRYIDKQTGDGQARWEIDSQESEIVKLIFTSVAVEGMSLAAVQRKLSAEGIQTAKGRPRWHTATLRGILINPAYKGAAQYGKTRLSPRKSRHRSKRGDPAVPRQAKVALPTSPEERETIPVPAIVSEPLFEAAGKRMAENRRRQRERQQRTVYLLSGLVICGSCGSAFCARRSPTGGYLYYRCIGTDKYRRVGGAICENRSVKGEALESHVWPDLCELLKSHAD